MHQQLKKVKEEWQENLEEMDQQVENKAKVIKTMVQQKDKNQLKHQLNNQQKQQLQLQPNLK